MAKLVVSPRLQRHTLRPDPNGIRLFTPHRSGGVWFGSVWIGLVWGVLFAPEYNTGLFPVYFGDYNHEGGLKAKHNPVADVLEFSLRT